MASEHVKRFSTSSLIQKMQTKTIIRYSHALGRPGSRNKTNQPQKMTRVGEDVVRGSLCPAGGDGNGAAPGETVTVPPPEDRRRAATRPMIPGGHPI